MIRDSFSKVNIGLRITGRRKDGYHTIQTVFQELLYGDKLTFEKLESGCKIYSNAAWVPLHKKNICYQAYSSLKKLYPQIGGVSIRISKKIPAGSGLGGGSANAALTLNVLNEIYALGLNFEELEVIGAALGADVPFFIRGGTQRGEGTGSDLTPVNHPVDGNYLLVFSNINISTAWAYGQAIKILKPWSQRINFTGFFNEDFTSFEFFENDFERIVIPAYPQVGAIKYKLLDSGARFASLSGSGSTVYGIFDDEDSAKEAETFFPKHKTILTRPANH
ncbi:MAG: 4-(cytidine 5'-diphospho)-2-C-methyl-D-erythritol kinase [Candidatus Neomarinimicrobiota bacterium]